MVRSNELIATIWRRGRGILYWKFIYVVHGKKAWFSTPGWYHFANKFVYRMTFDHDYPTRPLWLGRKKKGKIWLNTEKLYEPIAVQHNVIIVGSKKASQARVYNAGPRRGKYRVRTSQTALRSQWRSV